MKTKSRLRHLISLALTLCMILAISVSAFASSDASGNDAVQEDKQGVLQVRLGFKVKNTNEVQEIATGTGFLINEDTLVTCCHVVNFDEILSKEDWETIKKEYGMSRKEVEDNKKISVSVYRDMTIKAKIKTQSEKVDLAVLELDQPLKNKKFLEISTAEVKSTAPCYSLGFPGLIELVGDVNTYTSDDVTITAGTVNKLHQVETVNFIAYSANMTGGGSGGPVVNYAGDVIGIHDGVASGDGFDKDFRYAVDVRELMQILDPLGIEYVKSSEPPKPVDPTPAPETETEPEPEPEPAPSVDLTKLEAAVKAAESASTDGHNKAKVEEFKDALENAKDVQKKGDAATQTEVNTAAEDLVSKQEAMINSKPDLPIPLPAIIAIVAAVIILIIVAVVLMSNKRKDTNDYPVPPYPGPDPTPYPNPAPFQTGGFPSTTEGTSVLGGGTQGTTVLGGSGATTVLNGGANYGTLTRSKNGEQITINKDQFKVGRERSRVDLCISDNTAVGRLHAIIVSRGGNTYVVDQNSTNCTFVNSQRASANQEVPLKNGDKITFADEDFTYHTF